MTSNAPYDAGENKKPQNQTDESNGAIKGRQQTDATMDTKNLPRGSEMEADRQKG